MKLLSTALCLLFNVVCVLAQPENGVIEGRLISKDGLPLSSVSVFSKGTSLGTQSDREGFFTLKAPAGNYQLILKSLGNEEKQLEVLIESGRTIQLSNIQLAENPLALMEMVVTGQSEPQSLRNSVYQVRTIDSERIRMRGATSLQAVLNTELGIRFSNDLTLGTSDIQLMGMSGQNVKILLDGIPMVDRGSTRESLGQIDINSIERIEIVEGPMSVMYGTDALAGVINIITKKGQTGSNMIVSARLQEETAGDEYKAFDKKGTHNQSLGLTWQNDHLQFSGNVSRNNFGGWQGNAVGREKDWMPKEQMLYTAGTRYQARKWNIWYRFNGTDETLRYFGRRNVELTAVDKDYISKRWFHQVQSEYKVSEKLNLNAVVSYTDYSRRTLTTKVDANDRRTLSLDAGSQDKSVFTTAFFRGTAFYKVSDGFSVLAGIDFANNESSGARISGTPAIAEYALFLAPEVKIGEVLRLTPGLRFLKNSVYDAPPVIPSLNGKLTISKTLDFRFGYARGFRSPALRELYFDFVDASHSIHGNTNLKAEYSNSFNSFLVWQAAARPHFRLTSTLGGFYNIFHDQINLALDPKDASRTSYFNISLYKTTGFTIDNKLFTKQIQASIGGSYIGRYNQFSADPELYGELPQFEWSPEINANLLYTFTEIRAGINLFYKYTGKLPSYESTDQIHVNLAETAGYHTADITINKSLGKYVNLLGGVKNLLGVTTLNNTSTDTGGAHSTGGAVPMSYGRSWFLGLNVQWSKN
ncbi:TonB-dependent receptor [Dyadobacter sp.]|uniref:TonB-dependent receptor n=1 Tax=Dyadobacter sp. TaxID=1914288 RepID=UPI003F6E90A8